MTSAWRRPFVTTFVLVLAAAALLAQSAQENAADAARLVEALQVRPGSTVGEVGAGSGELTVAMAQAVGSTGRVFTNEIEKDRLKAVVAAVEKAGLQNVTAVDARPAETNFPDACCDAIFMRNVYHHFGDPPAMNASLLKSLKPGGRLAVIDFTPPPGQPTAAPGRRSEDGQHGVRPDTVEAELKAVGFEIVSTTDINARGFMVVAARPAEARSTRQGTGRGE